MNDITVQYSRMENEKSDENEALILINHTTEYRYCTKSKVLVFGLVAFLSCSLITVAVVVHYINQSPFKCELPIFDKNGALLNESAPCSKAMRTVLSSHFLPKSDLYSTTLNGIQIWKPFPEHCFIIKTLAKTAQRSDVYENIDIFYKRIATDTGVGVSLIGKRTMGATLSVKTDSLSAGITRVMGTSFEIYTHTRSITLDPKCYKISASQLTSHILTDFDALPTVIDKPENMESWQAYDTFLKKWGTHFTNQVIMGSSLRQWTFAKSSESYSMQSLQVKACFDLFSAVSIVPAQFNACSKIMKESAALNLNMATSYNLEIRGGTEKTRNKLIIERTPELIEKLLNEGSTMEQPIEYKYIPLWDIFLMKYGHDKSRSKIAMNIKQYYEGMLDFGCTLIEIGGEKVRRFKYRNDDNRFPIFQCELAKEGCRSDSDCHLGPSLSVTYCYGSMCLEHAKPSYGSKAKSVIARKSRQGSYSDEVNDSCRYELGITAGCYNNNEDEIIWNGAAH
eukprot:TCONS_00058628-protein